MIHLTREIRPRTLTQSGAVRSVGRQPEHDERETSEEHTGQREDVGREHHIPPQGQGEGQHGVVRLLLAGRQDLA